MQDPTAFFSPKLPDLAAIEALVAGERPGVAYGAYARILDEDLAAVTLTDPPNPADPSDVTTWVYQANLTRNTTQDVVTQVDLKVDSALADQINMLIVYIQFFTVYWDMTDIGTDGEPDVLMTVPRAIVGFEIPDRSLEDGYTEIDVTGMERTWRIRDLYVQNPFVVPAGMRVTDVIGAMLQMDNLTPDEGGREPSGTPGTGAPQQFVAGPYCAVGVTAASVCLTTNADGSLADPNGLFAYNPDANIYVDAATNIPIDPWTCTPMTVVYAQANTCQASNGVYFNTLTGAFYRPAYPAGFDSVSGYPLSPIDPFTLAPLPAGRGYYIPDAASPSNTDGNTPCPLLTWPYDYTGAGPYYEAGGAAQTTSGGGSSPTSGSGPADCPIGAAATIAQRDGTGLITLVDAGQYSVQPMLCSNDPALAGHTWCQPQGGVYRSDSASVDGYDWPAGTWTLTVSLRGGPVPAGTVAVYANLYLEDDEGSLTFLGATAEGTPVSFASGVSAIELTTTIALAGVIAPAGAVIVAEITLDVQTDLTCTLGSTVGTAAFAVSALTVSFPTPTVTGETITPPVTTGGNGEATPTGSGTNVVWPDSNNPGMAPSGCATPGPNVPAERLNIVPSTITAGNAVSFDRTVNLLAAFQTLTGMINYNPLWSDEVAGVIQVTPKPLFSDGIPDPVWHFTTEAHRVIVPPVSQKLADQTGIGNKVIAISANNAAAPIVVMATNESPDSEISIPNLGRVVMLPPIENDNVSDEATLQLIADTALQAAAAATEAIQITVATCPFLQPYDPIDVTVIAIDGETLVDGATYAYFITQIQEDLLDPTSQQITAGRTVAI